MTNHSQQPNPTLAALNVDGYQAIVEHTQDLIIRVCANGYYTYVNPAFCAMYNATPEELIGRHYSVDVLEDDREMVDLFFAKLYHPPHTVTFTHREKTAFGIRHLEWTGKAILAEDGSIIEFVGIARDISERIFLIEKLAREANHDDLTGLANRRFLTSHAQLELQRAKRYDYDLSLLMIDIDHFKNINDIHGHQAGDIALVQLSELMISTLREHDLISRIGGEEFTILLPETNLNSAVEIAERMRVLIEQHTFEIFTHLKLNLTISIGVATLSKEVPDFISLLSCADQQLYRAKANGRNCVSAPKNAALQLNIF